MIDETLNYYYDLAFDDGLELILSEFPNNQEILNSGFEYIPEHNVYLKHEMIEYDQSEPDFVVESIDRSQFIQRKLRDKRKLLYSTVREYNSSNDMDKLEGILNNLHPIYLKIGSLKDEQFYSVVYSEFQLIVEDLKIQLENKLGIHPIFQKVRPKDLSVNLFECKELPFAFFEKLHTATYELDLIDDVEIPEQVFIDVFTVENPNPEKCSIRFIKSNLQVAYYLKSIEPFFNNFNGVSIEKSKCFLNKQNKPLNATDLYAALSRGKDKNLVFKRRVDEKVSELKTKYLE